MSYELPNPTNLRIKPVYNTGDYGEDLVIPLVFAQASNINTLTPSTASFHQTLHDSSLPIDDLQLLASDTDKCGQLHSGNDTNFDKTFIFTPDMTAWIYKVAFTIGFGLKVSAFTNGTINVGNIRIIMTELGDDAGDTVLLDQTTDAGSSNLTGTGEQIVWFHLDHVSPVKVNNGKPITIQITTQVEETGTNTWQVGMLPLFPSISTAIPKLWITSQMELHAHASLDHAFPIWRDEDNDMKMDYSGIPASQAVT